MALTGCCVSDIRVKRRKYPLSAFFLLSTVIHTLAQQRTFDDYNDNARIRIGYAKNLMRI